MKKQQGSIAIEYLLATAVVVVILFGMQINDENLWTLFQDAFQTRHNNYSQSISTLDDVNLTTAQGQNENNE
jgi:Flp pilus assembly pilin Flp